MQITVEEQRNLINANETEQTFEENVLLAANCPYLKRNMFYSQFGSHFGLALALNASRLLSTQQFVKKMFTIDPSEVFETTYRCLSTDILELRIYKYYICILLCVLCSVIRNILFYW